MWATCCSRRVKKGLGGNRRRLVVLGVMLFLFPVLGNITHAQQLNWVKQAGGAGQEAYGNSIGYDGSGNVHVTGSFFGAATFGEAGNQTTLTSSGDSDIFVARYRTDGTLAWAKKAGGTFEDYSVEIAVDDSGNSYVTGFFSGTATFGEPGSEITLGSSGGWDIFVAKFRNDGTLAWAKKAGGTSYDVGWGISVDGNGNVYMTGWFSGTATFGEPGSEITLGSSGGWEIFVAKFRNDGTLAWIKQAGSTGSVFSPTNAVDGSGNVYVTGQFSGTATFGDVGNEINLTSTGSGSNVFLAKYGTDGTLAWAKQSEDGGKGEGIAVDGSGNSYVTGDFYGTATFGEVGNQTILTSSGDSDIFVAKYGTDGTLAWAKKAGGTSGMYGLGQGIAVDGSGNSYVAGAFYGTATFGEAGNQTTLTSSGDVDIFVAKYGTDGTLAWAIQEGGSGSDVGWGIAVAGYWNIYVAGDFNGTATFGEAGSGMNLNSRGSSDIFLAKYTSGEGATPAGPDIVSVPTDATIGGTPVMVTFDRVDGAGGTTTLTTSTGGTPPPTGFALGDPPTYYDIETTAPFTGNLQICIDYSGVSYGDESNLRLFYDGPGGLEDITDPGYPDTENNIICGTTSHLSMYVIMEKKAYQFVGFFEPVQSGAEVVNLANAGRTIPMKWQLIDGNGGFISDLGAVTGLNYQEISCAGSSNTFIMPAGDTLASGSSGLRYDAASNQFVYTWKTEKSMVDKCYRLNVELFHLETRSADFEFE